MVKTRKTKRTKRKKSSNERVLILALGLTFIILIGVGIFLWLNSDSQSTLTISPEGTTVMTSFDIETDSWCERNPVFCNSSSILDRAMCWMPSSVLLPAAGSGSCWAITTMEISWFHLTQRFSFLPDLHTFCESTPGNVSTYLAGIQQNRKAVDNGLALLMTQIQNGSLKPAEACRKMKHEISNGEPLLVVIVLSYSKDGSAQAAHGVVAYGYTETGEAVRFLVADSNTLRPNPSPEQLIFNPTDQTWEYQASYHPKWYNLGIGFLKISSLGVPSLP